MTEKKTYLNDTVLVLNRNWEVAAVTNVRGAISNLYSGKFRVVGKDYMLYNFASWADMEVEDGEPFIRTVKSRIKAPEIVLATTYAQLPVRGLKYSRYHVIKRDHAMCQYCGAHAGKDGMTRDDLTIDHVTPKSRGGVTSWTNCVVACLPCNHKKADKTPEEAGMKLRKKPVKPKWSPRKLMVKVGMKDSWEAFSK